MPLYDFHCESCGYNFEHISGHDEEVRCPDCGDTEVVRRVSFHAGYKIKGDNSASVTPKRFRSEQE